MVSQSLSEMVSKLRSLANPDDAKGMERFAIMGKEVLGIKVPVLRDIAKETGKHHELALELWETGIHEARILATMIDRPEEVTEEQLEKWVSDLDSWDLCDHFCGNIAADTRFAEKKIHEWSGRKEEFVKRAAFVLIAEFAFRKPDDESLSGYLDLIKEASTDDRNFVKKAVNWALRNIGKRNMKMNREAIEAAEKIAATDSKAARWIASDALRELNSEAVQERLKKKDKSAK